MRFTQVCNFYASHVLSRQIPFKASSYHIRGKPRRVLRDDGSDYLEDRGITPKEQDYRRRIERLERLGRAQLSGLSPSDPRLK